MHGAATTGTKEGGRCELTPKSCSLSSTHVLQQVHTRTLTHTYKHAHTLMVAVLGPEPVNSILIQVSTCNHWCCILIDQESLFLHAMLLINQSACKPVLSLINHVMQMKTFAIIVFKVCPSCAPMVNINMTSSKLDEKFLKVAKDMHSILK